MKKIVSIFILLLSASFVFISCNNDEGEIEDIWYSYGSYFETESNTQKFIIELDNGYQLIPLKAESVAGDVKDSSRVLVFYVILSEMDSTVNANVKQVNTILSKEIIQLTEAIEDSIGNDPAVIRDNNIWLSEYHLNVIFGYYGWKNVTHYINLVRPIEEQKDVEGRQILEFRHNANNDIPNNYYTRIVSFDMRSLYEEGMDSINFVFKSTDYSDIEFTWVGTYYFKNQSVTKSAVLGSPPIYEKFY